MVYYIDNKELENNDYSLYITTKYVMKIYNLKLGQAIELIQQYPEIDTFAKALGRQDIGYFALYFLRDSFVPSDNNTLRSLAKIHYAIFEELNNMYVYDLYDKEEFILPRGIGKSTVINKLLTTWAHCYKLSEYTVVIANKEDDAIGFIDGTKSFLTTPLIVKVFGKLIDKNNKNRILNKQEIELDNDTKIYAMSSGSSIRGTTYSIKGKQIRPSLILCDDLQNEADILSDNAKEKVMNKINKEILESGDKPVYRKGKKVKMGTKFLFIATPLASDDAVAKLAEDSSWVTFQRSVVSFDIDEYFNNNPYWLEYKKLYTKDVSSARNYYIDNKKKMDFPRLWEDKWQCDYIAQQFYFNRLGFMSELMCDCSKVGDIWITNMVTIPPKEFSNYKKKITVMAIDQASTNTAKSDSTAITILSKTTNNFYLVKKGILKKWDSVSEYDQYLQYIIKLLIEYKEITHIYLEKNVYKGRDAEELKALIKKTPELSSRRISILCKTSNVNKDSRIATITEKINRGQVIFNEEDIDYNNEVKDFKGQKYTAHDDAPDSLEMAISYVDSIKMSYGSITKCSWSDLIKK